MAKCVVCNRKLGQGVCPCDPQPRRRRITEDELFCERLEEAERMNSDDDDDSDGESEEDS